MSNYKYPLRLACCDAGNRVTLRWLDKDHWGETIVRQGWDGKYDCPKVPFDPKKFEADWVLTEAPNFTGGGPYAVRIRFCPGCGTETPRLRRKKKSSYHKLNCDDDGNCRTCKARYCEGQNAARVFEIDVEPEPHAQNEGLVLAWWNVTNELSAHRIVLGTGDIAVSVSADDNSDFGVEIGTQWSARAHKLPGANAKQRGVIVAAFGGETRGMHAETLEDAMDEVDAILSKSDRLTLRKG